jgi:hypothetical protein
MGTEGARGHGVRTERQTCAFGSLPVLLIVSLVGSRFDGTVFFDQLHGMVVLNKKFRIRPADRRVSG